MSYPLQTLSAQRADWNDLSLDFQLASYDTWGDHGHLAKNLFCLGA